MQSKPTLKIFDKYGSYINTTIVFSDKICSLIGSTSNGAVMSTLDEFKSNCGSYVTLERERVAKGFILGKITVYEKQPDKHYK